MKSKKGMEFEVLVKAIIVLVVLVVSIAIYLKYTNKGTGILDNNINNIENITKGSPPSSTGSGTPVVKSPPPSSPTKK